MPYLIIIALIVGVLWLAAQAVAFLVGMAAIPAAMLAAPSVAAMRAINAFVGFHPYDIDLYVILHALLGGAIGLSGHMMVRHLRPGERMVRALGFMQRALHWARRPPMKRRLRPEERMVRALGFMQRALRGRAGRR